MRLSLEDVQAVVLAGGLGTRVRHLLGDLPKPMAPVCGRPFVEWVLRYLASQGIRTAHLATGHRAAVIEAHFASQPVPGVTIACHTEPRPLGTAGAVRFVAGRVRPPPPAWLVVNGDSLIFADLKHLIERLRGAPAGLVARRVDDASRFGTLEVDAAGRLRRFAEKVAGPGPGLINAGAYLLGHELVETLPATEPLGFECEIIPGWLRAGVPIAVLESAEPFLDIGTEEALGQAEGFIRENLQRFAK